MTTTIIEAKKGTCERRVFCVVTGLTVPVVYRMSHNRELATSKEQRGCYRYTLCPQLHPWIGIYFPTKR